MQTLKTLRSRFGSNFELLRWVTYLFFGGALNAFFIQLYADFILRIPQIYGGPLPSNLVPIAFYVPLALLLFSPLILSIILSRAKPEKQPVPPLYITLISIGLFAGFILFRYPSDILTALVLYAVLGFIQGRVLNAIARSLLGIAVKPNDFVWAWFTVNGDSIKLISLLETPKYRHTLGMDYSDTDEETGEVTVECATWYDYRFQITPIPKSEASTITAVFYDRADWYVMPKDDLLKESAETTMAYLLGVLKKNGLGTSDISWNQTTETDRLVSLTMKKMAGVIPRAYEISRWAWAKIIMLVGVLVYITWLGVFLQDYTTAAGLLVVVILYIVFELRSGTFSGETEYLD